MTIVTPPFALDFGRAWVYQPPDFPENIWVEWEDDLREQFDENWPVANRVILAFRHHGIYWLDANTNNLRFD